MFAMKEALKRQMKSGPKHVGLNPPKKETLLSEEQKENELGDKAPELGEAEPHMSSELGPEHMDLLMKLISQMGHPGRSAMTLDERGNDQMKEKMASIMKHKKAV